MSTPHALPLLDLSPFAADESSPEAQAFVDELREVVHTVGFLYVTGHGVDPELATRIHDVTRAFFALPEADRLEIENVNSPQFRGYTRFGHEVTNGRVDLRDQIDISREVPARAVSADEPQWLRLRGPNLWPSALPELRDVVTDWLQQLETLGQHAAAGAVGRARTTRRPLRGGCRPTRGAAQAHPLRHAVDRRRS